eukprot:5903669-Amphidinium_carterae.1
MKFASKHNEAWGLRGAMLDAWLAGLTQARRLATSRGNSYSRLRATVLLRLRLQAGEPAMTRRSCAISKHGGYHAVMGLCMCLHALTSILLSDNPVRIRCVKTDSGLISLWLMNMAINKPEVQSRTLYFRRRHGCN